MPLKTQPLFPVNQTTSFIDTSTDHDDLTSGNYSGHGQELKRNDESFLDLWSDFDKYKHTFWGIVLCITLIGTIGNTLVFIMMGDKKLSYLCYSVYLKFMAVSDSCLLITTLIHETEKIYFQVQVVEIKIAMCMLPFGFRMLSSWLVVGLTIDRYACVCFPLRRERLCTRMKAIVLCSSLLGLTVVLILPFPFYIELVNGECFPSEKVKYYFMPIQLLFSSTLPCLVILVLNILIVIQIQRSRDFRNTFISSTTNSVNRQQDNPTRPLVLVSVLAFVTMVPGAIAEAVIASIRVWDRDFKELALLDNIWSICLIIYLFNFAQNFYILVGSSSNYRQILRKRLTCCTLKWNHENRLNQAMMTNIRPNVVGSDSATTSLSLVSIK